MRYNIKQLSREERYEVDGGYKVVRSPNASNERKQFYTGDLQPKLRQYNF